MSEPQVLATITNPASLGLPAWAANYKLRRESDGRLFLVAEVDGCTVYAQPKAWRGFNSEGETAMNYGVQLKGMSTQAPGTVETNDPSFDGKILQGSSQVPLPFGPGGFDVQPYLLPGAIVLAAILIFIVGLRKRS